ncbi:class I SAM-dependent methyltransferase [Streptomyces sp. NPDC090029]|uniref:class I SAM-dependent methyltransferase n=1 Tax=Streptomyces sp. NPDC090029 TaxID=3365924 RepID=UPI00382E56D6
MTEAIGAAEADRALKSRHRAMWALGDYPALASELIPALGRRLVDACGIGAGQRVLDVAAGSGNAAIPAALAGAEVVATDLTPALLERGRLAAEESGVRLEWREADAEALPFPDAAFDTVMSCVGVMFAPHHEAAAAELLRVCRPGGTIGLVNWTPQGFVGRMFAVMKPYAPTPPPGAQPPPLWGDEAYVRELLGEGVSELGIRKEMLRVESFATPEAFRDYFATRYGPAIAVYRGVADDPGRTAALDRELADLARHHGDPSGSGAMDWEYLLAVGRRTG